MEVALVGMARQFIADLPVDPRLDEIPFDADRMRMSTVHQTPEGPALYCKGAPESVLPLCEHILAGGRIEPLGDDARSGIVLAQGAMAQQGLRVLVFAGLAGLEDPPRPEVPEGTPQVPGSRNQGHHGYRRPPAKLDW